MIWIANLPLKTLWSNLYSRTISANMSNCYLAQPCIAYHTNSVQCICCDMPSSQMTWLLQCCFTVATAVYLSISVMFFFCGLSGLFVVKTGETHIMICIKLDKIFILAALNPMQVSWVQWTKSFFSCSSSFFIWLLLTSHDLFFCYCCLDLSAWGTFCWNSSVHIPW